MPTEAANVRGGGWMTTVGKDLHGATLGLLGLGRIGGLVAKVGQAFGMETIAWSQNLDRGALRLPRCGPRRQGRAVPPVRRADRAPGAVAPHAASDREAELRSMKPTAILVNTSRGPIFDEADLARACAEGWIAGAGLDAYGVEPLPADDRSARSDNVLTPHVGYVSEHVYRAFFADIVTDIEAWAAGEPIRLVEGSTRLPGRGRAPGKSTASRRPVRAKCWSSCCVRGQFLRVDRSPPARPRR